MTTRIFVTRQLPPIISKELADHFEVAWYPEADRAIPRAELLQSVQGVQGILSMLTDRIDAEVFDAAGPSLKMIANLAVGYDNIDIGEARRRGVMVTNTPGVLTETTADLTFALLLATARRVVEASQDLRAGLWNTWSPMAWTGRDVFGANLGIVGLGQIGEAVAKRARGFDMRVLYHNRKPNQAAERRVQCEYRALDALLREADFVVMLTPLTPETRRMIGAKELALMKPTSVLINVARGPVVDENALFEALAHGRIWGAGLDVYEREPISMDHPLLKLENVVLLPHIGSATVQTRLKMAHLAAQSLKLGLTGQAPPNRVV